MKISFADGGLLWYAIRYHTIYAVPHKSALNSYEFFSLSDYVIVLFISTVNRRVLIFINNLYSYAFVHSKLIITLDLLPMICAKINTDIKLPTGSFEYISFMGEII